MTRSSIICLFVLLISPIAFSAEDQPPKVQSASDTESVQTIQYREFKKGEQFFYDDNYKQALTVLDRFLEKFPQSRYAVEARCYRGICHYYLKQYSEAKQDLDFVLAPKTETNQKDSALFFCGLANYQLALSNPKLYTDAKQRLEELLKQYPNFNNKQLAQFNLAQVYEKLNDVARAKEIYAELYKNEKDPFAPYACLKYCQILFNEGAYKQCVELTAIYPKKWSIVPEKYEAATLAADSLYKMENFDKAVPYYAFSSSDVAVKSGFARASYAAFNKANCFLAQKKYADAAKEYVSAINRFPKSKNIDQMTLFCGESYKKSGALEESKKYYLKAAQFDSVRDKANLELADIYYTEKNIEKAIELIDSIPEGIFSCDPSAAPPVQAAARQACILKANIYKGAGDNARFADCVKLCDEIVQRWETEAAAPEAALIAAAIVSEQKNYQDCIQRCQNIQQTWRQSSACLESQVLEAFCLLQTEQYNVAANKYYNLYLKNREDKRRLDWLLTAASICKKLQKHTSVVALLAKELPNFSKDLQPTAMSLLAEAYYFLRQYDNSIKVIESCRTKYPQYDKTDAMLLILGMDYQALGKNKDALTVFESILQQYPDTPSKQQVLTQMAESNRLLGNVDEALKVAEKIIAQKDSPERPDAIFNSLLSQFKNNKFDETIKLCDLFIEDYPQHKLAADSYRIRAMCKYKLQDFIGSVSDCRKGLEAAKQTEQLDKYEFSLRQTEVMALSKQPNAIEETQKAFNDYKNLKEKTEQTGDNDDAVVYLYANALFDAKKTDDAIKWYKYLYDNYMLSPYRFDCAYHLGADALQQFKNAEKKEDENAKKEEFEKTAQQYLGLAADGTDVVAAIRANYSLGVYLFTQQKYPDASKRFEKAVDLAAKNQNVNLDTVSEDIFGSKLMISECLYGQEEYKQALAKYLALPADKLKSPKLDPPVAYLHLIECAVETKDYATASSWLDNVLNEQNDLKEEYVGLMPFEPAIQYQRFLISYRKNKYDDAKNLLVHILKKYGNANTAEFQEAAQLAIARSWFYLGELLYAKRDYEKAIETFYNVLMGCTFEDLQADACYEAGRCYEALKQYPQAIDKYQQIINQFPKSPRVPYAKSRIKELKAKLNLIKAQLNPNK